MNIFSKITFRNLKKNRTRTLVTIIGIALSAAMFSAVTFTVSSLQQFLINYEIYTSGSWHVESRIESSEEVAELKKNEKISDVQTLRLLGFAKLEESQNEYKPYLCVEEMSAGFTDMMPVHLTEGRLPENASEIILPNHLKTNGGIEYSLNETITLSLGDRIFSDGYQLDNTTMYLGEEYSEEYGEDTESLQNFYTAEYTVVGFCERPDFEAYSAPGYTALTVAGQGTGTEVFENASKEIYEVFFTFHRGKDATEKFLNEQDSLHGWTIHYELLRLTASSGEASYNRVFYGMAAILVLIIMFGTISLIYNAFSISVSERTKQFGILTSVGATRKQLKKSVLTEAGFLSIVGIPLGILFGFLGMSITFHYIGDQLGKFLLNADEVRLVFHPSIPATVIAVIITLITILISALIPAVRASRKSAMDAIRQSNDIKVKARKLKTSPLTRLLFGFEGTLATKNFKRNRKRYRATVFSLFISVVLFISASCFGLYLEKSAGYVYDAVSYEIEVFYYPFGPYDRQDVGMEGVEAEIRSISDVEKMAYYCDSIRYIPVTVNKDALTKEYLEYIMNFECYGYESGYQIPDELVLSASMVFVEDEAFKDYLEDLHLSEAEYFNPESPKAVIWDDLSMYNMEKGKYEVKRVFNNIENADLSLRPEHFRKGYTNWGMPEVTKGGEYIYKYASNGFFYGEMQQEQTVEDYDAAYEQALQDGRMLELSMEEATAAVPIACDMVTDRRPEMAGLGDDTIMCLYFPYSQMENVFRFYIDEFEANEFTDAALGSESEDNYLYYELPLLPFEDHVSIRFTVACGHHKETAETLRTWVKQHDVGFVNDYAEEMESAKAMLLVIRVFAYGFIILISLIAVANVFNTIYTNINLRRREFAMLKSVGLTPKGFHKMMIYECLLYGIKGLLYGLPVSFGMIWLIHRAISEGIEMTIFIPWTSIGIAIGSVFVVVSVSMVYAVSKIRNKNTIDEMKNENL